MTQNEQKPPSLQPKGIKCVAMLVCPYIHPILSDYIGICTPEFTSETFRKMFGKGLFTFESISSKANKKINLSPFLSLNNFLLKEVNIQFPDEKEFFHFSCSNISIILDYRNWYKEKLESFIDYVVSQIEAKENPLESRTVKSAINNIKKQFFWDNFKIDVNNLEIIIRYQQSIECILSINKLSYDHTQQKGEIKGIAFKIKDNIKKQNLDILKEFDIDINYNGDSDQLKLELKKEIKILIKEEMYESIELLYNTFNKNLQKGNNSNEINNNILYDNVDKEDNIDLNKYTFEIDSLLKNSKSLIEKRLIDNKEKSKKEAKKPVGFFGFSWGKKEEDKEESSSEEPVKLSNEENEKLNTLLNDEHIQKFLNRDTNQESSKDDKNQKEKLISLPNINPFFDFNNNIIELIVEFKINTVKDCFKLEIGNIIYNNETLTYEFKLSLLLVNQNQYIISSSLYSINIIKEDKTNTSIINLSFDALTMTISYYLIHQLKQLFNMIINSKVTTIINSFNITNATTSIKANIPTNLKINLKFQKIKLNYIEQQCSSYIEIMNSFITIIPPCQENTSQTSNQPISIKLHPSQIDVLVNNNSPLFLFILEFLLKYDPNANNDNNNNKVNESSNPIEIDLQCNKFNIIYFANPTKIFFSLNDLHYIQNSTLIDLSSSSFHTVIDPHINIFIHKKEMKMKYDLPKNKFVMTMPSPMMILNQKTLDTIIKAFTLELEIDIEIIDFVFEIIFTAVHIEYDEFLFSINSLEIGNHKGSYLFTQINEFLIHFKKKKLLTENNILLNIIEDKPNKKKEINIEFSDLNVSVTSNELYNLILLVNFKDLFTNNNNTKTSNANKEQIIYLLNLKLNCVVVNLLLPHKTSSNNVISKQETISLLSMHNILYNYNPGNSSNIKEEQTISIEFITIKFVDSFNKELTILSPFDNSSNKETTPTTTAGEHKQIFISKTTDLLKINIFSVGTLLRFDAIFFLYYFFYNSIPFNHIITGVSNNSFKINVEIQVQKINFLLLTDFEAEDFFSLEIPDFQFNYIHSLENNYLCKYFYICIKNLSGYFTSKNKKRMFISTTLTQNANDFLRISLKISDIIDFTVFIENSYIRTLYSDFISLLKASQINLFYINNDERLLINSHSEQVANTTMKDNNLFEIDYTKVNIRQFTWNVLSITLIDDAKNKYLPFLTFTMNNLLITSNKNNINIAFNFNVDSYNYIALTWEPTIEQCGVIALLMYSIEKNITKLCLKAKIETLLLNISDMNVSFVFAAFTNWMNYFQSEKKKFDLFFSSIKTSNKMSKQELLNQCSMLKNKNNSNFTISNNTVVNYSSENIQISYNDENINVKPLERAHLEYLPQQKERCIELKYKDKVFKIPIEKIGSRMNSVNSDCYFISEIALTKDRTIDINIYSPIIILNQTNFKLQVVVKILLNSELDNKGTYIFSLEHNHLQGIPFSFISNKNSIIYFIIGNEHSSYYLLSEVLSTPLHGSYIRSVNFEDKKKFQLKMINEIPNVRTLVIGYEYSIVNALPFMLEVRVGNKLWIIEKGKKENIDIKKEDNIRLEFLCNKVVFFNENKIFQLLEERRNNKISSDKRSNIIFKDLKNKEIIIKSIFNSKKELILYSEYIIKNESEIPLNIKHESGKKGKKSKFIFLVNDNLFLISSLDDFDKRAISFQSQTYTSNKIEFESLLESSSNKDLILNQYNQNSNNNETIELRIRNNLVNITIENDPLFNETIITNVFSITGTCFVINNLPDIEIIIRSLPITPNKYQKFPPLTKLNYHQNNLRVPVKLTFYNLQTKKNESIEKFLISNEGINTLYILDCFINFEFRLNNFDNILEIIVNKCQYRNAKVVLDNRSSYDILIQQVTHNNEFQIIESKKQEICKIYNQMNLDFVIITDNHYTNINFKNQEQEIKGISDKIFLQKQTNGIKTKITFFDKDKKESSLNNSIWKFDFSISISQIIISLISDNEFIYKKVNKNYTRNEISLIVIDSIRANCQMEQKLTFDKISINLEMRAKDFIISNQISDFGKYPIFIQNKRKQPNDEFIILKSSFNYYTFDNIVTLHSLLFTFDKLNVSIDPNFLFEVLNFIDNVFYRSNLSFQSTIQENDPSTNTLLLYINNLILPQIDITLKLSKLGLHELLQERFGVSSFSCKIIEQLAGHTNKIKLKQSIVKVFTGGFLDLIEQIILIYKDEAYGLVNSLGLRGIGLAFQNVFKKEEAVSQAVEEKRIRLPRTFYGKYKYIKNYNNDTAMIQKNIMNNYVKFYFLKGYHFVDGFLLKNYIIVFTTITMFVFNRNFVFMRNYQVDYFCIKNVSWDIQNGSMVNVLLTQEIDGKQNIALETNEKGMGKRIGQKLIEFENLYKDELSYID